MLCCCCLMAVFFYLPKSRHKSTIKNWFCVYWSLSVSVVMIGKTVTLPFFELKNTIRGFESGHVSKVSRGFTNEWLQMLSVNLVATFV